MSNRITPRAKAAIDGIPYVMGTWTGKDNEVPLAAQRLLRPNAILSRTYLDNSSVDPYQPSNGEFADCAVSRQPATWSAITRRFVIGPRE